MSGYGYPQNPPPHGYGGGPPSAQPYGQPSAQPHGQPTAQPYGQPTAQPYGQPTAQPYGQPPYHDGGVKPPKESKPYGASDQGHGYPSPAYGQPPYGSSHEGGVKPPKENKPYGAPDHGYSSPAYGQPPKENKPYGSGDHGYGYPSAPPQQGGSNHGHGYPSAPAYGQGPPHQGGSDQGHGYPTANPFAAVLPSTFPPGTDPSIVACFQVADQDGSGLIDDKELQRVLSSYNQSFSIRTVHLLMYSFTDSNARRIGPKEFVALYYSLQSWREIFERFDRDRSGKIDASELREALYNLGFSVSPVVLDLLVSKFDKTGGKSRAIEYDNFIECCLTVKGLTEKFKSRDKTYTGTATFTYEDFMLAVLPFLIA